MGTCKNCYLSDSSPVKFTKLSPHQYTIAIVLFILSNKHPYKQYSRLTSLVSNNNYTVLIFYLSYLTLTARLSMLVHSCWLNSVPSQLHEAAQQKRLCCKQNLKSMKITILSFSAQLNIKVVTFFQPRSGIAFPINRKDSGMGTPFIAHLISSAYNFYTGYFHR